MGLYGRDSLLMNEEMLFIASMRISGLQSHQVVYLPLHIVIMRHVFSFRCVMMGQGNEPRGKQGGVQSGGAEACLQSGTERQAFVWLHTSTSL